MKSKVIPIALVDRAVRLIKRRDRGEESLTEIGRSYNVSAATISRLTAVDEEILQ